jgi:hypothetical protein
MTYTIRDAFDLTADELRIYLTIDTDDGPLVHDFATMGDRLDCNDGCAACAFNNDLDERTGTDDHPMTPRQNLIAGLKYDNPDDVIINVEPSSEQYIWIVTTDKDKAYVVSIPDEAIPAGRPS